MDRGLVESELDQERSVSEDVSSVVPTSPTKPILKVECEEPEGTFVREVRPAVLTVQRLKWYYENLQEFDTVFNEFVQNDLDSFIKQFIRQGPDGRLSASGLIWEVDDVGILYLTDLKPGVEALGHFNFWDQRFRGREELIREMLRYIFKRYGFHRIRVEAGLYANPATFKAIERIGFKKEGRKREATRYDGEWWDVNVFAILEQEVRADVS